MPPTRLAEPQWMNTGWLLLSATAARKLSTTFGVGLRDVERQVDVLEAGGLRRGAAGIDVGAGLAGHAAG